MTKEEALERYVKIAQEIDRLIVEQGQLREFILTESPADRIPLPEILPSARLPQQPPSGDMTTQERKALTRALFTSHDLTNGAVRESKFNEHKSHQPLPDVSDLTDGQRKMAELIATAGSMTTADIIKATGMNSNLSVYYLRALTKKHIVNVRRLTPRRYRYHINPKYRGASAP